jgi:hypothetical protein
VRSNDYRGDTIFSDPNLRGRFLLHLRARRTSSIRRLI